MPFNLNDLTTNYGSQALHNANNQTIEDEVNNNLLKRNNPRGDANQMEVDLDMNSNDINNVNTVSADQIRLAGELLSTSPSALPLATEAHLKSGRRNLIINGNFDIWQRGTSFSTSVAEWTADRWLVGTANVTTNTNRMAFSAGQTDVPNNPAYYINVSRPVAAAGTSPIVEQRIEDVRTAAGETITVSFYAKSSANKTLNVALAQVFGSGGSATTEVKVPINVTTSWQKFEVNFDVLSIAGKTIGTDSWLDIAIREDSGFTAFSIDIAQVQLEKGSYATDFEYRPIAEELALCQRYYEKSYDLDTVAGSVTVNGAQRFISPSTAIRQSVDFKVRKRAAPSTTIYASGTGNAGNVTGGTDGDVSVTAPGTETTILVSGTGATAVQSITFHFTADAEL